MCIRDSLYTAHAYKTGKILLYSIIFRFTAEKSIRDRWPSFNQSALMSLVVFFV